MEKSGELREMKVEENVKLVVIHGLGSKPSVNDLSLRWKEVITRGLLDNEGVRIAIDNLPLEVVYWASETTEAESCLCKPRKSDEDIQVEDFTEFKEIFRSLWNKLSDKLSDKLQYWSLFQKDL